LASSRSRVRYLVAICIGIAGTLACQSYGEATKQIIATTAPGFGWSPEARQMITNWVQQLGWTKQPSRKWNPWHRSRRQRARRKRRPRRDASAADDAGAGSAAAKRRAARRRSRPDCARN
jgi:hypothetical protein